MTISTNFELFDVTCRDGTVIVRATTNLNEFRSEQLLEEAGPAIDTFEQTPTVKNVILDFTESDYFGSTALGLFVKLWKLVRSRDGRMAMCGLSPHEKEVLAATRLDTLWDVCDSREQALGHLHAD